MNTIDMNTPFPQWLRCNKAQRLQPSYTTLHTGNLNQMLMLACQNIHNDNANMLVFSRYNVHSVHQL